jgi:hypothetical protein
VPSALPGLFLSSSEERATPRDGSGPFAASNRDPPAATLAPQIRWPRLSNDPRDRVCSAKPAGSRLTLLPAPDLATVALLRVITRVGDEKIGAIH